jgi:hypothetical protein
MHEEHAVWLNQLAGNLDVGIVSKTVALVTAVTGIRRTMASQTHIHTHAPLPLTSLGTIFASDQKVFCALHSVLFIMSIQSHLASYYESSVRRHGHFNKHLNGHPNGHSHEDNSTHIDTSDHVEKSDMLIGYDIPRSPRSKEYCKSDGRCGRLATQPVNLCVYYDQIH